MQKLVLPFLLAFAAPSYAQQVVRFSGVSAGKAPVSLDSVQVENQSTHVHTTLRKPFVFSLAPKHALNERPDQTAKAELFPNPFEGELAIEFVAEAQEKVAVQVISSTGQLVAGTSQDVTPGRHQFRFTPSASGLYHVSVIGEKTHISQSAVCLSSPGGAAALRYQGEVAGVDVATNETDKKVRSEGPMYTCIGYAAGKKALFTSLLTDSKDYVFQFKGKATQQSSSASVEAAASLPITVNFQANTNSLYKWTPDGYQDLKLGMAPGTSPAVGINAQGVVEVYFQANTNNLFKWTAQAGYQDLKLGMAPGTSPVAATNGQGVVEVYFQANTNNLFKWTQDGYQDLKLGIAPGTSPAAATNAQRAVEVYFQANTNNLFKWTPDGYQDLKLGMAPGTNPAVGINALGAVEVYFQANTNNLFKWTPDGYQDLKLGMAPGTSPAAATPAAAFKTQTAVEVYFQANTHNLFKWTQDGYQDLKLGMAPGTSPAAATNALGAVEVYFQANTNNLFKWTPDGYQDLKLGMAPGTSPATTSTITGTLFTLYSSEYDAVQVAAGNYWKRSIDEHLEYGGVIYKVNGADLWGIVAIRGAKHEIGVDGLYPTNSQVTAYWHTHPNRASRGASPADIIGLKDELKAKTTSLYTIVYESDKTRETPIITRLGAGSSTQSAPKSPAEYLNAAAAASKVFLLNPRDNKTYAVTLHETSGSNVVTFGIGPASYRYSFDRSNPSGNTHTIAVGPVSVSDNGSIGLTVGAGVYVIGELGASISVAALFKGDWARIFNLNATLSYGTEVNVLDAFKLGISTGKDININPATTKTLREEGPGNNWGEIRL